MMMGDMRHYDKADVDKYHLEMLDRRKEAMKKLASEGYEDGDF